MKKNKVLGILLLVLAVSTIVGMIIENNTYWFGLNYVTIAVSLLSAVALLKQK
jgi:uncharacterized membrane protein YccC